MPFGETQMRDNLTDLDDYGKSNFIEQAVTHGGLSPEFKAKFQPGTFKYKARNALRTRVARRAARVRAPRRHAVRVHKAGNDSSGDSEGSSSDGPRRDHAASIMEAA